MIKDSQQTTYQPSLTCCTRDPDARTTLHLQETMTPHPHAVADHGRSLHWSATEQQDLIQQILPTSSSRFKSGEQTNCTFQNHERDRWTSHRGDQPRGDSTTWNVVDDQTLEASRTLHAVRAMCGILRHTASEISDVDPCGRPEDIQLASRSPPWDETMGEATGKI